MKLKYLKIEFDSAEKVYVAGSKLNGVVRVGFEKPTKMTSKIVRKIGLYE